MPAGIRLMSSSIVADEWLINVLHALHFQVFTYQFCKGHHHKLHNQKSSLKKAMELMSTFSYSGECCLITLRKLLNTEYQCFFHSLAAEFELGLISNFFASHLSMVQFLEFSYISLVNKL